MKMFVAVVLALQVCAGVAYTTCGSCKCYEKNENNPWPHLWPNKKLADCAGAAINVFPSGLPADIEVLNIEKAGPQFTSLQADILTPHKKLTEFRMESSHLQLLHEHTFQNSASTLTIIKLYRNNLTEIPTKLFSYTPNVVEIDLESNKLRILQTKLFSNLKFLKKVWLDYNKITIIEKNSFHNLPSLETVYLHDNKIQTLSLNIMPHWNTLKLLTLNNNPWDCKTELCPLMHVVNNRQLWGGTVPSCATPENLKGKEWNKLQRKDIPHLLISPNFLTVNKNANFTLECQYCFPSELRWSLNGKKLPNNYQNVSDHLPISKLTVQHVQKQQQGNYRCYIDNCKECGHVGVFVEVKQKRLHLCHHLPCN